MHFPASLDSLLSRDAAEWRVVACVVIAINVVCMAAAGALL